MSAHKRQDEGSTNDDDDDDDDVHSGQNETYLGHSGSYQPQHHKNTTPFFGPTSFRNKVDQNYIAGAKVLVGIQHQQIGYVDAADDRERKCCYVCSLPLSL